jgi:hypothetical protein
MSLKPNISKFSFGELTSNSNGKTSGSGTAGIYIVFIGGVCFLLGCIDKMFLDKSVDIITQSIILIGIGAGLLGYRKSKDSNIEIAPTEAVEEPIVEEPTPTDTMLNS